MSAHTKKVIVFGATGVIGSALCQALLRQQYLVTVVARDPSKARTALPGMDRYLALDFQNPAEMRQAIEQASIVCNLTGAPLLAHRFSRTYAQEIRASRVDFTQNLVALLTEVRHKPELFLAASATGFYDTKTRSNEPLSETSRAGQDALAQLVQDWEQAAEPLTTLGIRTLYCRTGLLLNNHPGGALAQLARPFRLGVGGPVGDPTSWRSWIHQDDEIGMMLFAIEHPEISGPLNFTAPQPVQNVQFAKLLAKQLRRPNWLPVPELLVRVLLGKNTEIVTRGRRIIPTKALVAGYQFKYPELTSALADLLPQP